MGNLGRFQIIILVCLGVFISGCVGFPENLPKSHIHNQNSERAFILIGVESYYGPVLTGFENPNQPEIYPTLFAWVKIDPSTGTPTKEVVQFREPGVNPKRGHRYLAFSVPPGTWRLAYTMAQGKEAAWGPSHIVQYNYLPNKTVTFTAAPGEIIYLGEYKDDLGEMVPLKFDLEKAQKGLREFPDVQGQIRKIDELPTKLESEMGTATFG